MLLRWQTIRCLLEHARGRRTLDSMAPQPCATPEASDWATDRVTALPEFWTLVAEHSGIVGAWRLTGVCTAAREGAKGWLRTLPRYSSRDWWLLLPFTFTG